MTKKAAVTRLKNKISKMSDEMILSVLKDMAKPWDKYTSEERMVKAYLYDEYEDRNGEEACRYSFRCYGSNRRKQTIINQPGRAFLPIHSKRYTMRSFILSITF